MTKKKRCEYFVHCAGFHNSFLPNAISVWFSPISKGETRGKVTNKFINKRNVEQRCSAVQQVRENFFYKTKIKLSQQSLPELTWWKESILLQNNKPLKIGMPQLINQTDAYKTGWGAVCQGTTKGRTWSYHEWTKHINVLELIAVKLAILTFIKGKSVTAMHLQTDDMTVLYYLVKMGKIAVKNCYK